MNKYFVIIPIEDDQPLFGEIEERDESCAWINFLLQQRGIRRVLPDGSEGHLTLETYGEPIVVRLTPLTGPSSDPDFASTQRIQAWGKYNALPGAQLLDPSRVSPSAPHQI